MMNIILRICEKLHSCMTITHVKVCAICLAIPCLSLRSLSSYFVQEVKNVAKC